MLFYGGLKIPPVHGYRVAFSRGADRTGLGRERAEITACPGDEVGFSRWCWRERCSLAPGGRERAGTF